MREDPDADIGDDALAEPGHEIEADGGGECENQDHGKHGKEVPVDQAAGAHVEAVIDDAADGDRNDEGGARGHDQGNRRQGQMPGIGQQERQKPQQGSQTILP